MAEIYTVTLEDSDILEGGRVCAVRNVSFSPTYLESSHLISCLLFI